MSIWKERGSWLPQLAGQKRKPSPLPLATTHAESCCPPWRGWLSLPRTERQLLLKLQGWRSGWQLLQTPQLGPSPVDAQSHMLAAPCESPVRRHLVLGRAWLSLSCVCSPLTLSPWGRARSGGQHCYFFTLPPPTAESVMSHGLCGADSPLFPGGPNCLLVSHLASSQQDKPRPDHILTEDSPAPAGTPCSMTPDWTSNLEKTSEAGMREQMPRQTKGRDGQHGRRVTEAAADWTRRVRRGRTRGSC